MFDRKFRHFSDLPVLRDFLCIEPKGLPATYQKISIVTKCFFVTKFVTGGLGPKFFSTFGPPDASRKKTIKFRLMRDIAFYSPCFCLSNRVWHEQIVSCMMVTDPNNFKCHGIIFAIFWHQKTHYFLQGTHQNLTHRMHDATHCMHHGTCATHVPWCMSGSLTHGGGENVPGIPGARANRNCAYL